jgi:hypothetical protein
MFIFLVVGCAHSLLQNSTEESFSVCFPEPNVRVPSKEVVLRIKENIPAHEKDRLWKQTLATHESGGHMQAVSVTGCIGIYAISPQHFAGPACCQRDAEDRYEYFYDLCNSEQRSGYRCDPKSDPRFGAVAAALTTDKLLAQFRSELSGRKGEQLLDSEAQELLPVFWNAGLKVFQGNVAEKISTVSILSQLDFRKDRDYQAWQTHGLANKIIEIYDYLQWFPFLSRFWQNPEHPGVRNSVSSSVDASWVCVFYDPDKKVKGSRVQKVVSDAQLEFIRRMYRSLRIKRLEFGTYRDQDVFFSHQSWSE